MRQTLTVLFLILALSQGKMYAQEVYFASIQTQGGRGVITGFLYRVGDSTIQIMPGRIRRDLSKIQMKEPLSIPISVIKAVAVRRVRPYMMIILESVLMSTGSAVISIASTPNNPKLWLPIYFVTSFTVIAVYSSIVIKTYKPNDHFFREKLEDKCIVKDERSIAASSPPPEVR